MMNGTYRGIIILAALVFLSPLLGAEDFAWELVNALARADLPEVDRIVGENADKLTPAEKRLAYRFALDYTRNDTTLRVLELLSKYGIHAVPYDLFNAVNRSHGNRVINVILNEGVRPNGEILLAAAERQNWDLVRVFAGMGADVNFHYPQDRSYADGMTALIHAAKNNSLETVAFLVEHGADVNLRTSGGATAASVAYESGLVDIYDYLKAHGALDFAQNPAPAEDTGGSGISSQGIANFIENGSPAFKSGTYRLSGSTAEITLSGGNTAGYLSYRNSGGSMGTGVFRVTGNTLFLITEGITFSYCLDTDSSCSGNGEAWVRTGD